jgi:hypothetical protein
MWCRNAAQAGKVLRNVAIHDAVQCTAPKPGMDWKSAHSCHVDFIAYNH